MSKNFIDFTGMSDAQLIAFFKKPSIGSVCGRFYNDQLERDFECRGREFMDKIFFSICNSSLSNWFKNASSGKHPL
jgi:hypothetical protein